MGLTVEDVERIALLAGLELTADEKIRFVAELSGILDSFSLIGGLVPDDGPSAAGTATSAEPARADLRIPSLPRGTALSMAPATDGAFFLGPPVQPAGSGSDGKDR